MVLYEGAERQIYTFWPAARLPRKASFRSPADRALAPLHLASFLRDSRDQPHDRCDKAEEGSVLPRCHLCRCFHEWVARVKANG